MPTHLHHPTNHPLGDQLLRAVEPGDQAHWLARLGIIDPETLTSQIRVATPTSDDPYQAVEVHLYADCNQIERLTSATRNPYRVTDGGPLDLADEMNARYLRLPRPWKPQYRYRTRSGREWRRCTVCAARPTDAFWDDLLGHLTLSQELHDRHTSWSYRADTVLRGRVPTLWDRRTMHAGATRLLLAEHALLGQVTDPDLEPLAARIADQVAELRTRSNPGRFARRLWKPRSRQERDVWVAIERGWAHRMDSMREERIETGLALFEQSATDPHPVATPDGAAWLLLVPDHAVREAQKWRHDGAHPLSWAWASRYDAEDIATALDVYGLSLHDDAFDRVAFDQVAQAVRAART